MDVNAAKKAKLLEQYGQAPSPGEVEYDAGVDYEKFRGFLWKVADLEATGQQASAGIALGLANGDPELWGALRDAIGNPGGAGAALTKAAVRGVHENTSYFEVAKKLGVPEKIAVPYLPDLHPAALLGFVADVASDPFMYTGIGALTQVGKAARAYTEAIKMGKPVEEMLAKAAELGMKPEQLQFGSTFAERLQQNQARYFVIEHPFRRPSVVRFGDVPALAKAGEAVREMMPFVPNETFAAFQRMPVGISVLKFRGQEGVEGGARVTLGHIPGSRVWTPKGFVRQVFNADKGIRDARL
jgi:hypothetical protein